MTNEQESEIPLAVDLQSASSIADELLRISPPYTGPKDSEATVEQNAARLLRRLAQRLRDMPEGERIEGWAMWDREKAGGNRWDFETNKRQRSRTWIPATLILHTRKEGESDE